MHGFRPIAALLSAGARNVIAAGIAAPAVLISTAAAWAAEPRLDEVVVTATALRKSPLETAQSTAILTGDELLRQASSSIGETLSQELGLSSSYFGPTASRPVIRGLGGFRVQVLDDGISSLDVSSLSPDHAVTIESVVLQQIEIIKGSAALLYGSGAAGGLVNVVNNRIPSERAAAPVAVAAELRGATAIGERTAAFSVDGGAGGLGLHLDYFDRATGDMRIPGLAQSRALRERLIAAGDTPSDVRNRIANTASASQGGAVGASYLADDAFAGVSWSRYDSEYGILGEDEAFIGMKQDRFDAKARWTPEGSAIEAVQFRGAYNDYTHTEFESPGEAGTVFNQAAHEARVFVDHRFGETWSGTVGVQYLDIDFEAIGDEAFVPKSTTEAVGLFGFEEMNFGAWTLELGARAERQTINPDPATGFPRSVETATSLSTGAVWKFAPGHALAVNVTRTQRNPQAVELYADGPHIAAQRFEVGAPDLGRESAATYDLSLRHVGDGLAWIAGVFYYDYTDYIFPSPTGDMADGLPVFKYVQDGASFRGFEAELTIPLLKRDGGRLELRLASDYVRGRLKNGNDLPQIPPLRLGIGLHFERGRLHAGAQAFYYDAQDRIAANELPSDGFTMLDADVSYRMALGRGDLFVFLRGTNLLDEEARQHASPLKDIAPLPRRSLHAGLRAEF